MVMLCVVVYAWCTDWAHTLGAVSSQLVEPAMVMLRTRVACEVRVAPLACQERSGCPLLSKQRERPAT